MEKWGKVLGITLAVLIVAGAGVGFYLSGLAGKEAQKVASACTEKEKQLQSAADALKAQLATIAINGRTPDAVNAYTTGDCLTGDGAIAKANFNVAAPDATSANASVLEGLHTTAPTSQTFALGNQTDGAHLDFLTTKLKDNSSRDYTVNYYLTFPISCPAFGDQVCRGDSAALETYGAMRKPVSKIELISEIKVEVIVD